MPTRWVTRSSGRNEDKGDFSHDGYGKEAVAGAAPIVGSAGAGSRQGAKSPHSQAHSEGCDSGKGAARGAHDGTVCAGGLPDAEAAAARLNPLGGLRETGGLPFFSRRAHLLTTPKGRWYLPLASRALSEGNCGCCDSLQTMPQHLRALLSSSAQVSVVSVLETACDLPAQTCHRQLYLRL